MRRPALHTRVAVGLTKLAVAGVLGVLAVGGTAQGGTAVPRVTTGTAPVPGQAEIARLSASHRCSMTGFAPGVVPGSAIVRRAGQVRLVGFDEGWAVYTGAAPGTLVAVCLDAP